MTSSLDNIQDRWFYFCCVILSQHPFNNEENPHPTVSYNLRPEWWQISWHHRRISRTGWFYYCCVLLILSHVCYSTDRLLIQTGIKLHRDSIPYICQRCNKFFIWYCIHLVSTIIDQKYFWISYVVILLLIALIINSNQPSGIDYDVMNIYIWKVGWHKLFPNFEAFI